MTQRKLKNPATRATSKYPTYSKEYVEDYFKGEPHDILPEPEFKPLQALASDPGFAKKHLNGPNIKAVEAFLKSGDGK